MTIYNWDRVPPEYEWVATDKSGRIIAYSEKPRRDNSRWEVVKGFYQSLGSIPPCLAEGDSAFWSISLEQRPKPKPRYRAMSPDQHPTHVMYDSKTGYSMTLQQIVDYFNREDLNDR